MFCGRMAQDSKPQGKKQSMRSGRAISATLKFFQHHRKVKKSSLKDCISTDSTQKTFQKWARVG